MHKLVYSLQHACAAKKLRKTSGRTDVRVYDIKWPDECGIHMLAHWEGWGRGVSQLLVLSFFN